MRLSLHRIPRETKVAAVVLGAALVQVGVLAALGLRSTEERRQAIEGELAERARPVVTNVVREAQARVYDEEMRLWRALTKDDGTPAWDKVRAAMDGHVAPLFEYAYLIDEDGRLTDHERPPFDAPPAPLIDAAARERVDALIRLERDDPARAIDAARALADELAAKTPHDALAAALALRSGWRAAYARNERDRARTFANDLLARYRTVRDDRTPLAESEPMGPAASAVVCDVLASSLVQAPLKGGGFVQAVLDRRIQAQRLRPVLSEAGYRVEVEACERLLRETTVLFDKFRTELRTGLEVCAALDDRQKAAQDVGTAALRTAAGGEDRQRFELGTNALLTVIPFPKSVRRPHGPIGAAFVAPPSALKAMALEPTARFAALPDGVALAVRDSANHDILGRLEGPVLGDDVSFQSAVPGLHANAVLVDTSIFERETAATRRLWLAILAAAALAVVAASLLALRAVLREVKLARMKSDFVSNLSHELRTPLTSLRMFVETLREGRVRDEAEAKECLDVIAQETDRLQSLVERVLQFASFTRGRAPIDLRSADAGEVARRAVALFRKRAEAARATIELAIAEPLPESILDRDAVLQVFLNLLDNAVKYAGHDAPKIKVGVRAAGPAGAGPPAGVVIEVEDDGPGVPERERELVFEEFYRGDDTLSTRVQGTGIGLAVARRIVLAHGGRIEVGRSKSLGGASFRVTLPAAEVGRRLVFETAGRQP